MASHLNRQEHARRYLEASRTASSKASSVEQRKAARERMRSHEREYPGVREHAIAGATGIDFDTPLHAETRLHQRRLRERENLTQHDLRGMRQELRGESEQRRRNVRREQTAGPRAARSAASSAAGLASSAAGAGGNTILYAIGMGLLLIVFYLFVAGKGAGALTGLVGVATGAASAFISPTKDPLQSLEGALGAKPPKEPATTKVTKGGLQEARLSSAPASAYAPASGTGFKGNKSAFANAFTKLTGLSEQVVKAWMNHEQGNSTVEGGNNWLNIEADARGAGIHSPIAQETERLSPAAAALATAKWIARNQPSILAARGKGVDAEVLAIENSGFAASKYGGVSPHEFLSAA